MQVYRARLTPGMRWEGLARETAMKALGFTLASLLLAASVLAQVETDQKATTADLKLKRAGQVELNGLIEQVNAAAQAKDWRKTKALVEDLLAANTKMAAAYPDDLIFPGSEPVYYNLLANAHLNLAEYQEAVAVYEKSVGRAQALRDAGKDSVELRKATYTALISEGNAYLKLRKDKEAVACYERAAEFSANPATAWFNVCAVKYNSGDTDGAVAAADKAIGFDPTKADAYFIKGSCLFANATVDAGGKIVASVEAVAAIRKYLVLAPNGSHAGDAKQMLDATGANAK